MSTRDAARRAPVTLCFGLGSIMEFILDIFNGVKGLIPSLVVAVVASLVTVHLSMRKFHAEKWWEKKEVAYTSLFEVLYKLKEYAQEHYDREIGISTHSPEERIQLELQWRNLKAEYSKLRDLASFHLSDECVRILDRYDEKKRQAESENVFELIEGHLAAVSDCLKALKREARRDLRGR